MLYIQCILSILAFQTVSLNIESDPKNKTNASQITQ